MKKQSYVLVWGTVLGVFLSFLIINIVFAIVNPLPVDNLEELIGAITKFIFNVAIIIAPIMFIIAGFFFITSAGEPEKVRRARNVFIYTLIGLVLVLLATGIYELIKSILSGE